MFSRHLISGHLFSPARLIYKQGESPKETEKTLAENKNTLTIKDDQRRVTELNKQILAYDNNLLIAHKAKWPESALNIITQGKNKTMDELIVLLAIKRGMNETDKFYTQITPDLEGEEFLNKIEAFVQGAEALIKNFESRVYDHDYTQKRFLSYRQTILEKHFREIQNRILNPPSPLAPNLELYFRACALASRPLVRPVNFNQDRLYIAKYKGKSTGEYQEVLVDHGRRYDQFIYKGRDEMIRHKDVVEVTAPPNAPFAFKGEKDFPLAGRYLRPYCLPTLTALTTAFSKATNGYEPVISEMFRWPAYQATLGGNATKKVSTHYFANTVDFSKKRYRFPDGEVIYLGAIEEELKSSTKALNTTTDKTAKITLQGKIKDLEQKKTKFETLTNTMEQLLLAYQSQGSLMGLNEEPTFHVVFENPNIGEGKLLETGFNPNKTDQALTALQAKLKNYKASFSTNSDSPIGLLDKIYALASALEHPPCLIPPQDETYNELREKKFSLVNAIEKSVVETEKRYFDYSATLRETLQVRVMPDIQSYRDPLIDLDNLPSVRMWRSDLNNLNPIDAALLEEEFQKSLTKYLDLLLDGNLPEVAPSLPAVAKTPKEKIETVKPTSLDLPAAKKLIELALNYISDTISPALNKEIADLKRRPRSSAMQEKLQDKLKGQQILNSLLTDKNSFSNSNYLALMIKESWLDPKARSSSDAKGLFQLRPIGEQEVVKYFSYTAASIFDPSQNTVCGILFLARSRYHYAKLANFNHLPDNQNFLLTCALYNKGYNNVSLLWDALKVHDYQQFEAELSKAMCAQLKISSTPPKRKKDLEYGVSYLEYAGVTAYLDQKNKNLLAKPLLIQGKPIINAQKEKITLGQAGEMLRYARVIEGIANLADNDLNELLYLKTARKYLYPTPNFVTVEKGKGFWSAILGNAAYKKYLEQEINLDNDTVVEVILDFNRRYNPLKGSDGKILNDETSNLPIDGHIFIPNIDYYRAYLNGAFEPASAAPVTSSILPPSLPAPAASNGSILETFPPTPSSSLGLPLPPEPILESSETLDKVTPGQYVRRRGNTWIRDVASMKKGALKFKPTTFSAHPRWDATNCGPRTLRTMGQNIPLERVEYIILHSTASSTSRDTVDNKKAHFVIEPDGQIRYLIPIDKKTIATNKVAPHAGVSAWDHLSKNLKPGSLNRYSLGIEVVANEGQDWNSKQYAAAKALIEWLGGYFGLEKRRVLLHKQVSFSRKWGRGYKRDPYGKKASNYPAEIFNQFGLPDNSKLLDLPVARNEFAANLTKIKTTTYHHWIWDGLHSGSDLQGKSLNPNPPHFRYDPAQLGQWKKEIEAKRTQGKIKITDYTVKKGDTLYNLAQQQHTRPEIIMAYNSLPTLSITSGQKLKIPQKDGQ